jgi:hypothetical protein
MNTGQPKRVFLGPESDGPRRRKRMKFSKLSQLFLVSTIGLLVATLLTACAINTIDYVFVANSAGSGTGSAGQIQTYDADSEPARCAPALPRPSGGNDPRLHGRYRGLFQSLRRQQGQQQRGPLRHRRRRHPDAERMWSPPAPRPFPSPSTPPKPISTWSPDPIPPC